MASGKPLSVTQLNGYIKGVFEDELVLHNIFVYGEIYEFTVSGQNTFITLRDGDCSISCVRYGITEKYELGTKVLLGGSVGFYARGGRVSFVFRSIEPYGQSVQYAAFLKLKEQMRADGWFDNRPPLKTFMKDVVIVTSATGAVIHDFIRVVGKQPFVNVRLYPVKVQGDGAAEEIAAAIDDINAYSTADVVVVARGGGANVDLEPFNTRSVCDAVHRSKIPILSAVGHETDFTLCDFCASARAATPSVAGEIIVSANAALIAALADASERATRGAVALYDRYSKRLYRAAAQGMRAAERSTDRQRQAVENRCARIVAAVNALTIACAARVTTIQSAVKDGIDGVWKEAERRLAAVSVRLAANNPLKLLASGYARVYKDDKDVTTAADLQRGDDVVLRFIDGAVGAKVGDRYGV